MENVKLMDQMQVLTLLNIPFICTDVDCIKKRYDIDASKTFIENTEK
jgi:hypothetical protein